MYNVECRAKNIISKTRYTLNLPEIFLPFLPHGDSKADAKLEQTDPTESVRRANLTKKNIKKI